MRKRILAILICMIFVMQSFGTNIAYAEENTESKLSNVIDLKEKGIDPTDQFSSMAMKLRLLSDGNASIKYTMNLSNDYLNDYRNIITEKKDNGELSFENFPVAENYDTTALYDNAVKEYFDSYYPTLEDSVLPTPEVQITYDKEYYDIPEGQTQVPLYTFTTGEKIGSCDFTKDTDGNPVFTCKFSKIVYNRSDVDLQFSLNYILVKEYGDNETVVPVWDDVNKMVTAQIVEKTEGLIELDPDYQIKESSLPNVDTPYIDFTVNVASQDGYLNGQTVVDIIPEGLFVDSVALDGNVLGTNEYSVREGVFNYTFPSLTKDKSNAMTSCKFDIRLYLNASNYKKLMEENNFKQSFTNSVYLKNLQKNEQLTPPSNATTLVRANYIDKKGVQEDLYGAKFKWYVSVNSYFNQGTNAFIVDGINASAHTYDFTSGVKVTGADDSLIEILHPVEKQSNVAYEDLTLDAINRLTAVSGSGSEKQSIYYTYIDSDGMKQSVLIIPANKYPNQKINLTYYTVNANASQSGSEDDILTSGTQFNNKAKLFWDNLVLNEETVASDFDVAAERNIQPAANVLQKTFNSYEPSKSEITWNLSINKMGGTFDDVTISDSLDQRLQKFQDDILDGTGTITASYTKAEETSDIEIVSEANKVDGKPYYVVADTSNPNKKELQIVIGHVDEDESYEIHLETVIKNKTFFLSTAPVEFTNTASSSALSNGVPCGNESTATKKLSNNMINKIGMSQGFKNSSGETVYTTYNHKDHTTKWRTTINENRITLTDVRAVETLPEGSSLDKISVINIYKADDSILYRITSTDGNDFLINGEPAAATEVDGGYALTLPNGQVITWKETKGTKYAENTSTEISNNTLELTFSDPVSYKVEYEFYTKYDESYRKEVAANRKIVSLAVVNVYGKYDGEDIISMRKSNAISILPYVIEKKGWYNEKRGTITWTLYVNQDHINLQDYSVVENLRNEFEMDFSTFHVSTFDVSPIGERSDFIDVTDDFMGSLIENGTRGFELKIPESYKETSICVQFETAVTDNVSAKDAQNQASLNKGKVQYRKSEISVPSNMIDFNIDEFINSSLLSSLFITKVSSTKDDSNKQNILLSDTEFKLTAMKLSSDGWKEDTSRYCKKRTTKANGDAVFFNLEQGVLYKLEEVNATAGYNNSNEAKYVVFLKSGEQSSTYPEEAIQVLPNVKFTRITLENTPAAGLSFKLKGTDEKLLSGGEFKLSSENSNIADKVAVSDENGNVNFEALDPGNYTLTEVKVPAGYKGANTLTVRITVNEDGSVQSTIDENESVTSDDTNSIVVLNEALLDPSTEPTVEPSVEPSEQPSVEPSKKPDADVKGTLVIINTAEDNAREGFNYRVTGYTDKGTQFCAEYTTDALGMIIINDLECGTYVVQELMGANTTNYVLPIPQMIRIKSDNAAEAKVLHFHNLLVK